MIDPRDVTNFNRTNSDLEEFLIFCCLVHGKTALVQAKKLEEFLSSAVAIYGIFSPFKLIRRASEENKLLDLLTLAGIGQYKKLVPCLEALASSSLDLQKCSTSDLEQIHGIGPKTARYFLMHSRPNQKIATLDRHILAWLRERGYPKAPLSTPTKAQYSYWEEIFLKEAEMLGESPESLDLRIWKEKSSRLQHS